MATENEPLKNKYRPDDWDEFVGNELVIDTIKELVQKRNVHAYLLYGPRGCGKTSLARVIAKYLGCDLSWDFVEIDGGNDRGIKTIQGIREVMGTRPMGEAKVYFIDECHRLTKDAAEALLKSLDETPSHVYFILATTEPQSLLDTLRSRCTGTFQLSPLKSHDMMRLLKAVVEEEDGALSLKTLKKIVEAADGIPREALNYLEVVLSLEDEDNVDEVIFQAQGGSPAVMDLCRALMKNVYDDNMCDLLNKITGNTEQVRRMVCGYMRKVLISKGDRQTAARVLNEFLNLNFYSGDAGIAFAAYMSCEKEGE